MGSPGGLASLFGPQSQAYARFRPRYPPELYQHVLEWAGAAGEGRRRHLAVDLGCGSGQATADLAPLFRHVVGVDASPDQLAHAPQGLPNAEFQCAPAEATGLPNGCADLVIAAAALHWFDLPAAYREMRRLLKPQGSLAAWTYTPWAGLPAPEGLSEGDARRVQSVHDALVDAFWPFIHPRLQRLLRDRTYSGYTPSPGEFAEVRLGTLDMHRTLSVGEVAGWVRSWSAWQPYVDRHGEAAAEQVLARYRDDMLGLLGLRDEHAPLRTRWPLLLLLARGPAAAGGPGPRGGD